MIPALLAAAWLSASHQAVADTEAGGVHTSGATVAPAGAESATDPALPQALGRIFVAGRTVPGWSALTSTGYGYTEGILGRGDAHHRAMGALAIEGRPVAWLSFALRFDGRYDLHVIPAEARDDGWVGDPRLYLRADRNVGESLRLALRLGLWLPGGNAPSIGVTGATPDLTGALTYAFSGAPVWLTTNLGYRLDRSARTAEEAARLSASDRAALEVSAFDQILAGVGATVGRGPLRGFVEASADLLVGAGAPALSTSPARFGGGARLGLRHGFQVEVGAELATSRRPDLTPTAPLVPVPPRVAVWLGAVYRFGANGSPRAAAIEPFDRSRESKTSTLPSPDPTVAPATPQRTTVAVNGRVETDDGLLPSDLRVFVTRGEAATSAVVVDQEGRFNFSDEVGREIAVRVEAATYEPASTTVTLAAGATAEISLKLRRRLLPSSQIRGLVRSLTGRFLDAQIRIDPPGRTAKAEQGRFELDVEPGSYEITIVVPGYQKQRRHVQVEEHGVTVLNIDLRSGQ